MNQCKAQMTKIKCQMAAEKRILIVTGEASGDLHGAKLAKILFQERKGLKILGVGGDNMIGSGVEIIFHIRDLGVVGITEVFFHLRAIRDAFKSVRRIIEDGRIDLVILIDYPDFNLRIAEIVKKRGIPVIYYISPQIWAWRSWRIKKIARLVKKMIVILPFEEKIYRDAGVDCEFVGHPLLDDCEPAFNKTEFCARHGIDPNRPVIGMMPGSRRGEIRRILPVMMESAMLISKEIQDVEYILSAAPTIEDKEIKDITGKWPIDIKIVRDDSNGVIASSGFMMVASGTATLQTAIHCKPMVIIYRASLITYLIGRLMVRVKHVGLVNLVAGDGIVPEFIQHGAVPERISSTILGIMKDEKKMDELTKRLSLVRSKIGTPGGSHRAAQIVLGYI
ncbi:MAG TPA: lipid-A-disaccharide synthase [Nitrospiria bacterium]|nr:lipid-A-disaccharide synthase [Nitrospiria bacterium]